MPHSASGSNAWLKGLAVREAVKLESGSGEREHRLQVIENALG